MYTNTTKQYEYSYQDSETEHHHAYIIPALMEMISESAPLLESQPKPRILDIGCGNGSLSNLIAQYGYEVVGVEESESGVELAKQAFPNCQFIQGSIYNLPYAEIGNKFDIVIAAEVIEHFLSPEN
ncbi:class I SAM-dependent methyltransferase [Nodularia spumigena]|uniref:class I SAM-dependent methyltransferase n=1 Tax=Nodularia spumigena TaxID=70799 RepID=UPI00232CD621|nr:class I SAM-dependent methyltransferase [Nodularia spumigena]MDB9347404.1 class I SAM-dependent methyltransferase [Nodularia spumigena CS-588/01]MDB9354450.1 class I SAM-dependent methyltransferase [Nodularia spumigena CS-588/05]